MVSSCRNLDHTCQTSRHGRFAIVIDTPSYYGAVNLEGETMAVSSRNLLEFTRRCDVRKDLRPPTHHDTSRLAGVGRLVCFSFHKVIDDGLPGAHHHAVHRRRPKTRITAIRTVPHMKVQ